MISFSVFGIPVPQLRPRFARHGNFVRTYDPQKSTGWKDRIYYAAAEYMNLNKLSPIAGAIKAQFIFVLPRPKSLPKKVTHHVKRPDLDNLEKAVMDGLRGICFKDDSQIEKKYSEKRYPVGIETQGGQELVGVRINLEEL